MSLITNFAEFLATMFSWPQDRQVVPRDLHATLVPRHDLTVPQVGFAIASTCDLDLIQQCEVGMGKRA